MRHCCIWAVSSFNKRNNRRQLMRLTLSPEDQEIIKDLRGHQILEEVDAHKIQAPKGFMAFLCSDCDQIHDKFDFLCRISAVQPKRVHLFASHSGGMLLSPTAPTKKMACEHEIYRLHIADAMPLKALDLLISKCHAPCGAAYAQGLNFHDVLWHTFKGKEYVKGELPGLRVAVFTQICYPAQDGQEAKRRTYAVKGKNWWKYAERKNLF